MDAQVIVVGGGIVGGALAYGIARHGRRVVLLDGADNDLRAARANFGLVWVQGKGADAPEYSHLSRQSSELWPEFRQELSAISEVGVDYSRPGGIIFCLGENEYTNREAINLRLHNQAPEVGAQMVGREELERMLPAVSLGREVVGASYCALDGHVNPLQLLAALHRAIMALGGVVRYRNSVSEIAPVPGGFVVSGPNKTLGSEQVIVAAGLETPKLVAPLGLTIGLRPDRGQLLVTERLAPILPFPASGLRQTADGTVMVGATKEAEKDRGVTVSSATTLAHRATRIIPALASVRLVRQWSGFRVNPPDGVPIYAESTRHPGLFATVCHSGVTLAAAHALLVAPAIVDGHLSQKFSDFSNGRFDVPQCA